MDNSVNVYCDIAGVYCSHYVRSISNTITLWIENSFGSTQRCDVLPKWNIVRTGWEGEVQCIRKGSGTYHIASLPFLCPSSGRSPACIIIHQHPLPICMLSFFLTLVFFWPSCLSSTLQMWGPEDRKSCSSNDSLRQPCFNSTFISLSAFIQLRLGVFFKICIYGASDGGPDNEGEGVIQHLEARKCRLNWFGLLNHLDQQGLGLFLGKCLQAERVGFLGDFH